MYHLYYFCSNQNQESSVSRRNKEFGAIKLSLAYVAEILKKYE